MRHRVGGTKFNVDKDHRDSLLKNLLTSYIDHEEMVTTEAKAKALKSMFDKVITRAKKNDLHARRLIGSMVTKKDVLMKLFDTLLPRFAGRTSGYSTTTLLVGERSGDSAKMMKIAMILDPVAEVKTEKKEEKKTTRKKATKKSETSEEVTA